MMRHTWLLLTFAVASCGGGAGDSKDAADQPKGPPPLPAPETLSSRPGAAPGERLFVERCAMCHEPGGMGTGLLARRTEQPLLEKRVDLTPDFVIQAARMGIGNMPAIPRGEVSDADLKLIGDYLSAKKGGGK